MHKHLKFLVSLTILFYLASCGNQPTRTKGEIAADTLTILAGENWLKTNIESFFNNDQNFKKGFSHLCTSQYAEFKVDATNIDINGGMTEAEFKSKWGRRYSPYAGIGEGFMIAGNDFGQIEVTKCDFKHVTEMKNLLYEVLIIDKTFHSKFTRKVVIEKKRNSFLIDDVLEISNEFQAEN